MSRLLLPFLMGCSDLLDDTSGGACVLDGREHFSSVEELECGLGPDGVVLCHWSLTLSADGTWTWVGSDYGDGGTWTCSGSELAGQHAGGQSVEASWDAATEILTWDGVAYVPADR